MSLSILLFVGNLNELTVKKNKEKVSRFLSAWTRGQTDPGIAPRFASNQRPAGRRRYSEPSGQRPAGWTRLPETHPSPGRVSHLPRGAAAGERAACVPLQARLGGARRGSIY